MWEVRTLLGSQECTEKAAYKWDHRYWSASMISIKKYIVQEAENKN